MRSEDFGEIRETSSVITSVLWILGITSSHASRHCSKKKTNTCS